MGKGDKKTKRGKLAKGSYGKSRLKNKKSNAKPVLQAEEIEEKKAKPAAKPKKTKSKEEK